MSVRLTIRLISYLAFTILFWLSGFSIIQPQIDPARLVNASIIKEEFGPYYQEAILVAFCESGLNEKAQGDSGDSIGLFQINLPAHKKLNPLLTVESLEDPRINIRYAKELFFKEGWGPWTCKTALRNPNLLVLESPWLVRNNRLVLEGTIGTMQTTTASFLGFGNNLSSSTPTLHTKG